MPNDSWKVTVEDSIDSQPFAVVNDLVIVVGTPRSRDFVTTQIGLVAQNTPPRSIPHRTVLRCSRPVPWMNKAWSGEVELGENKGVEFELEGRSYRLTLKSIGEAHRPPWATYEFLLERMNSLRAALGSEA